MEGNALYAILKLGLFDERAERLAERLMRTQWPDGGWNCDSSPKAHISSFTESLIPLRALGTARKGNRKLTVEIGRGAFRRNLPEEKNVQKAARWRDHQREFCEAA